MINDKKTRVAVIGLGNVGKGVLDAVKTAPDMELVGVVVRRPDQYEHQGSCLPPCPVVGHVSQLGTVDVAILAVPSRSILDVARPLLALGIHTVDSFDMHGDALLNLRRELHQAALAGDAAAIIGSGWDPGTDSLIRSIFALQAPRGTTYTNFGPGMSMGHSVAAKRVIGVADAVAYTLPQGHGRHKRLVYVELLPGHDLATVTAAIKADSYFSQDETEIRQSCDIRALQDTGHGVSLERHGTAGKTANQYFHYESRVTNPALTGQILVGAARAVLRLSPGAYSVLEVPLGHYFSEPIESLIKTMV